MRRIGLGLLRVATVFARNQGGTAAIEFAIVTPMLLVLLIGIAEVGFATYEAMQVQDAAEAGAMFASQHPSDTAGIITAVTSATNTTGITATPAPLSFCGCPSATGITPGDCTTACASGDQKSRYVRVSAQLTHSEILHFPGFPTPLVLSRSSTVRTQ